MVFIRKIKKANRIYYAKVESYREGGKVKQKVIEYLGKNPSGIENKKNDILDQVNAIAVKQVQAVSLVHHFALDLGLPKMLGSKACILLPFIYNQIIEPVSFQALRGWVEQHAVHTVLNEKEFSINEFKSAVDYFNKLNFEIIENKLQQRFSVYNKGLGVVFTDITDVCFNITDRVSKLDLNDVGKTNKQIKIVFATSLKHGFPLYYSLFQEKSGTENLYQVLFNNLKKGFHGIILHKGKSGKKNIKQLVASELNGIIGLQLSSDICKEYAGIINTDEIKHNQNKLEINKTELFFKGFDYMGGKLIVVYNFEQELLHKNLNLFKKKFDKHSEYAGYSFIYHNTDIDDKSVVRKYFENDFDPKYFSNAASFLDEFSKGIWTYKYIEAYFKICYLTICLTSWMRFKSK